MNEISNKVNLLPSLGAVLYIMLDIPKDDIVFITNLTTNREIHFTNLCVF